MTRDGRALSLERAQLNGQQTTSATTATLALRGSTVTGVQQQQRSVACAQQDEAGLLTPMECKADARNVQLSDVTDAHYDVMHGCSSRGLEMVAPPVQAAAFNVDTRKALWGVSELHDE